MRDGGAPLDGRNITALCASHHSSKTAQVDGGFGNRRGGVAKLVVRGCDAEGNPIDPQHNWLRGALTGQGAAAVRVLILGAVTAWATIYAASCGASDHRGESKVGAVRAAGNAPALNSQYGKMAIKS